MALLKPVLSAAPLPLLNSWYKTLIVSSFKFFNNSRVPSVEQSSTIMISKSSTPHSLTAANNSFRVLTSLKQGIITKGS